MGYRVTISGEITSLYDANQGGPIGSLSFAGISTPNGSVSIEPDGSATVEVKARGVGATFVWTPPARYGQVTDYLHVAYMESYDICCQLSDPEKYTVTKVNNDDLWKRHDVSRRNGGTGVVGSAGSFLEFQLDKGVGVK